MCEIERKMGLGKERDAYVKGRDSAIQKHVFMCECVCVYAFLCVLSRQNNVPLVSVMFSMNIKGASVFSVVKRRRRDHMFSLKDKVQLNKINL